MNDIFGIDENNAANALIEELGSERQTLIGLIIDSSGSMCPYEDQMENSLEEMRKATTNSKEADEMLISKTTFNNEIKVGGYLDCEDFDSSYYADGGTRLFDAIIDAQERLTNKKGDGYLDELVSNGIRAKAIITIFSDGEDTYSDASVSQARNAIEYLKKKEIIVAFISFGFGKSVAKELGIDEKQIVSCDASEHELKKIMHTLSKSAISASQKAKKEIEDDGFFNV